MHGVNKKKNGLKNKKEKRNSSNDCKVISFQKTCCYKIVILEIFCPSNCPPPLGCPKKSDAVSFVFPFFPSSPSKFNEYTDFYEDGIGRTDWMYCSALIFCSLWLRRICVVPYLVFTKKESARILFPFLVFTG